MYNNQINNIIGKMVFDGLIAANNKKAIFNSIKEYFSDKLAIVWTAEDVISRAEDININITEEQAISILCSLQDNFNANVGINWTIMDDYIIDCRDNSYLYK